MRLLVFFAFGFSMSTSSAYLSATLLLGILSVAPAPAREGSAVAAGFPLTFPVRSTLITIQESWLEWDAAFLRSNPDEAGRAVSHLLSTAAELGMSKLPDHSLAVLARAVEVAREGDVGRARWAIDMAEQLDPKRPETRFAAATVARFDQRYGKALIELVQGYFLVGKAPLPRSAVRENLLIWILASLILSGGLFICLQIVLCGRSVVDDLTSLFVRFLPLAVSYVLALVLTFWPIFLPLGWKLLFFYWAVLLWRYLGRSASVVVLASVAVLLVAPLLLRSQQARIEVDWSKSLRAVHSLESGRLYGGLFQDLRALQEALPGVGAVSQLTADLHLDLGQIEMARAVYEELLIEEPRNAAVHNNLGGYYFHRKVYGRAIEHLEKAASFDLEMAEAHYNLYRVYQENLAFEEAVQAIAKARTVDRERVSEWLEADHSHVPAINRGSGRRKEIRDALLVASRLRFKEVADEGAAPAREASLPLLLCLLVAVVATSLVGRLVGSEGVPDVDLGRGLKWLLLVIPGLGSLRRGHGPQAFGTLLCVVAPLVLARSASLGYRPPFGLQPWGVIPWMVAVATLVLFFVARWRYGNWEKSLR